MGLEVLLEEAGLSQSGEREDSVWEGAWLLRAQRLGWLENKDPGGQVAGEEGNEI